MTDTLDTQHSATVKAEVLSEALPYPEKTRTCD